MIPPRPIFITENCKTQEEAWEKWNELTLEERKEMCKDDPYYEVHPYVPLFVTNPDGKGSGALIGLGVRVNWKND